MSHDTFFKDPQLPFAECRYSRNSNSEFKPHLHRNFSLGAIECGEVVFHASGEEYLLRPGMLAIIKPEVIHFCNTTSKSARSFYMLHLDPEWVQNLLQSIWQSETFPPIATSHLNNIDLFKKYCEAMHRIMSNDIYLIEKEHILTEIVGEILHAAQAAKKEDTTTTNKLSLDIKKAKRLLTDNLGEDITLNQIAFALKTNPYTLIRKFKNATGTTPHAFRMNCRIEQARILLQRGNDIADTAYECGFFDQSHLHRHFKAMTTVTPQNYKANFQA